MTADPIAVELERLFARTEPVCAAWVRREEAYDYVRRARPHELVTALTDWCAACVEYADAVIAAELERAAADMPPAACVSLFHDAENCRDGGLPVNDWCAPCLVSVPVNTRRRLFVVPELELAR